MNKTHVKTHEKRKGRENKIFKNFANNQIITACRIELRIQGMTMNEKLTMIGLTKQVQKNAFITYVLSEEV